MSTCPDLYLSLSPAMLSLHQHKKIHSWCLARTSSRFSSLASIHGALRNFPDQSLPSRQRRKIYYCYCRIHKSVKEWMEGRRRKLFRLPRAFLTQHKMIKNNILIGIREIFWHRSREDYWMMLQFRRVACNEECKVSSKDELFAFCLNLFQIPLNILLLQHAKIIFSS